VDAALEGFIPLCRAVAARYCPPWHRDFEDFCQEALIGAWEALRSFVPAPGANLRSFVELCARRKMYDLLKVRGRHPEECVLDAPAWPEDGERSPTLGERLPAGLPGPEEAALLREILLEFLRALSGLEREAVLMALQGFSYRQIAALGRDAKAVDNALARARRKARSFGLA